jgi:spore coat protein JB
MNAVSQSQLLEYINAMGLALVDTNEFLDTHPDCDDALDYFARTKLLYAQAKQEYARQYGPLTASDVDTRDGWTWIKAPWPWERGC